MSKRTVDSAESTLQDVLNESGSRSVVTELEEGSGAPHVTLFDIPNEWMSLYRVRKNQLRMIKDRGFKLDEAAELELDALSTGRMEVGSPPFHVLRSYAARADLLQTSIRFLFNDVYYTELPNSGQSIMVYYADLPQKTKSQGVDSLKKIFEAFDASEAAQLIIISEVDLGTQAQSNLTSLRLQHCWFFLDKQLLFNVTDHVLYSKHVVAKPSETQMVKVSQLPHIKASDVVARYFGFHRGQVIRIESFIPIPGLLVYKSITYRVVV